MAGKKNIPEVRFKWYNDELKESKLGDLALDTYGGGTPKTTEKEYWDGDIAWIQSSDLKDEQLSNVVPRKTVTKKGIMASATKIIPENSIAIVTRVGVGKLALMPYCYTSSQDFLSLSQLKIDKWFGVYSIWKKIQSELHAVQGTSIKGITKEELLSKKIYIPISLTEQSQIGTVFKNIDALIALHQHKYDKLITVKKSMLEKMFSQDGADVPEIRFKGFADNWKKCKLSDCLESSTDKNIDNVFTKNDVLSVSGDVGIVNQIEFQGRSFAGVSVANYGIVRHGEIVYTKSPLKANPFGIIKTNKGDDGIVSTLYAIYKPRKSIDSNFVENYFDRNDRLNHYLKPLVNKGAKNDMKVTSDNALKGKVVFPKTKDEQESIASFFCTINNLISLQQRELEKLKNIKKACIEKMFV